MNFVTCFQLYQPINIRVILVWADVWTNEDPVEITSNSDKTLTNFLEYRKGLMKDHPHDNAHLITYVFGINESYVMQYQIAKSILLLTEHSSFPLYFISHFGIF